MNECMHNTMITTPKKDVFFPLVTCVLFTGLLCLVDNRLT